MMFNYPSINQPLDALSVSGTRLSPILKAICVRWGIALAILLHSCGLMVLASDGSTASIRRTPMLIAHRGGVVTESSPECSLAALRLAHEQGYHAVELDVRASSDLEPVWFHDAELNRMTDLRGPVNSYRADVLTRTQITGSDQYIVSLKEVLDICTELGLGVMLDIKQTGSDPHPQRYLEQIADLLRQYEGPPVWLITTDPDICNHFKGLTMPMVNSDQLTMLQSNQTVDLRGHFWFGLPRDLPPDLIERLQDAGAMIIPAINTFRYPADSHVDAARMDVRRLFEAGIDTFQIDSVYKSLFDELQHKEACLPPSTDELRPYSGPRRNDIDTRTLDQKVMAGYQGWFRAPGDGVVDEWVHWSIDTQAVTADTLTIEMWPDLREYPKSELFPVPGMRHNDGSQAFLFSSVRPKVVDLHFQWMREYGLDGVFVQRFLTDIDESDSLRSTGVLAYARNAANRNGRAFALTYDMSGTDPEQIFDKMVEDWKFLVDRMRLTRDARYLYHEGKPVLMIWGFFPDRFDAGLAHRIIDFFKDHPRYGTTLIGGTWRNWLSVEDPEWARAYRRFDIISPWNTGRYDTNDAGEKVAQTGYLARDIAEARKHGMGYLPVIYPGFSWDNLQRARGRALDESTIRPRRGGAFLWEQFVAVSQHDTRMIYIAMFDEVDEGTAIFKVSNSPPLEAHFVTYEGLPSDWYLRLTGIGTRMFRGELPWIEHLPIKHEDP